MQPPEPELELTPHFLITREFHTSKEFSIYIEHRALTRGVSLMETMVEYCEERGIEPAAVAAFLTPSLKAKVQSEAEKLNLLKTKKKGRLPI
jgi:PII-like signaling protein